MRCKLGEAMNIAPEAAPTLAGEVYVNVRRRILDGDLRPGQPISRRTVAAEMRTGLIPVAEALNRLEFEGLLESRPRVGTRVRIPSREDVKGHYIVREALEVQAAMLVATVATAHDLYKLKQFAERVDALRAQNDNLLYALAHQGFHRRIAEYGRCQSLCDALEQTHVFATLWLAQIRRPSPDDSPACHRQLVEALSSGDPAVAGDAVRRHVALGLERTMEALEPYFRLSTMTRRPFRRKRRPRQASRVRQFDRLASTTDRQDRST